MTDSWSEVEERDFAKVMEAGKLERMPAIRLYRRCRGNLDLALAIATASAPSETEIARTGPLGMPQECATHKNGKRHSPKPPTKVAKKQVSVIGKWFLEGVDSRLKTDVKPHAYQSAANHTMHQSDCK